jgi:hypothetical protein
VRLVLLVADAPPHLDYQEQYSYDTDMIVAVRKGIKVFLFQVDLSKILQGRDL